MVGPIPVHLAHVVHAAYGIKVVIELLCCTIISAGYARPVFNMRKDILNFYSSFRMGLIVCLFRLWEFLIFGFLYGTRSSTPAKYFFKP